MNKKLAILTAGLLMAGTVAAQTAVKGRVTDKDGQPVAGAAVKAGDKVIALTDDNGNFNIAKMPAGVKNLVFSFIGLESTTVSVSGNMQVVMSDSNNDLDEVMVVAYGTAKKSSFTGSAAVLKADKIENRQVANLTKALGGAVSGVQALSNNGQPGTSSTIRIRGFGSLSASSDPLYVVDGVPYDGSINAINPQDIESMSVLKDAAAAALYGARGANGVVMIQTKKGKSGDARITLEARYGTNSRGVKNYDVLKSTASYMETLYQAKYNEGIYSLGYSPAVANAYANNGFNKAIGYPVYTVPAGEMLIGMDGKLNPNATLGYNNGTNFVTPDDWQKNTFSNENRQEYNLNISGGGDRVNYYLSVGYLSDNGVIANSGFERISARSSVDYQAKKWLKVGTNIAYTNSTSRYPGDQTTTNSSMNAFYVPNYIAPVYPMFVRNADGSIRYRNGQPVYDYGDGSQTAYTRNWMAISNPMGDLTHSTEEYLQDHFTGKWYANITPIEGLTLTAAIGLNVTNQRAHIASSSLYGQSANSGGQATQELTRNFGLNQQFLANYKKSFGYNNFDFLLGYESYENNSESFYAIGNNLYREGVWVVNNTIDQKRGGGSYGEYSTKGILFRTNYDWKEKYYASFSFRRDGSSRFHPDNRWGSFWSLSAAWDIAKEEFMQNYGWVNLLKLKGSFGQQGNDRIGNDYAYVDQYTMTGADGVFSDATLAYKGNKDLTWEKSNAFNVGVDFALWKGLLSGSVEVFNRQTSDMLYKKPVALSNGYATIPVNIGSMRNSGVELELNSRLLDRENLKWNVNVNATYLKNKILKLSPELKGELIEGSRIYKEGESMYQLYLVSYAGVDPTTGLALYRAKDSNKNEYLTTDRSVAYNTNRKGSGDLLPKVSGGFGTTLDFYGFDFGVSFSYQLGGKVFDSSYQSLMHSGASGNIGQNWHKDIAKAWTPTNTNTDVPRLNSSDRYAASSSDRWLVSSNYLALNNITLGYTLPSDLTKQAAISSLRVYVSGDNLFVLSARQGLDPRQSLTSTSSAYYTSLRTVTLGLKLDF